jgi:uncharacterized protein YndB with AHSA1/START domain
MSQVSDTVESLAPLRKVVVVALEQERAFELFTAEIGRWWPLPTHSVGLGDSVSVSLPSEVGGSIVETLRDGSTCVWGTITGWDPPAAISFSWHPGQTESAAGDVAVRFRPAGAGKTEVELTHSGWDRRVDGAAARLGYDNGWDAVLAAYCG